MQHRDRKNRIWVYPSVSLQQESMCRQWNTTWGLASWCEPALSLCCRHSETCGRKPYNLDRVPSGNLTLFVTMKWWKVLLEGLVKNIGKMSFLPHEVIKEENLLSLHVYRRNWDFSTTINICQMQSILRWPQHSVSQCPPNFNSLSTHLAQSANKGKLFQIYTVSQYHTVLMQ